MIYCAEPVNNNETAGWCGSASSVVRSLGGLIQTAVGRARAVARHGDNSQGAPVHGGQHFGVGRDACGGQAVVDMARGEQAEKSGRSSSILNYASEKGLWLEKWGRR